MILNNTIEDKEKIMNGLKLSYKKLVADKRRTKSKIAIIRDNKIVKIIP